PLSVDQFQHARRAVAAVAMILAIVTTGLLLVANPASAAWAPVAEDNLDNTYYSSAIGTNGPDLRSALHAIVEGNIALPYTSSSTDVWDALKVTDADPMNSANVIDVYSGESIPAVQQQASSCSYSVCWNREHTWPKSLGS